MVSSKGIMHALPASSVAMVIGAIIRESGLTTVLPRPGPEIFSWPIAGSGPWWSLPPVLFVAGAVAGALLAGPAWSRLGNRIGMALFNAVLIAGLVAVTLPVDSTELTIAGRLFLGIGSGALSAIVPTYVGRLIVLFPVIVVTGFVVSEAFGQLNKYDQKQPLNIQFNVYCFAIVVLHGIGLCFVRRSPKSSSADVFEDDQNHPFSMQVDSQWTEILFPSLITDYHHTTRRNSLFIFDKLDYNVDCRALLISIGCMFFHQMCGINVMKSYMIHVIKMSDIHVDPKTVFIILGIVQVIMMGVAIIIIDYKGRRILLISSALIMCLCLAGLTLCNIIKMQLNASTLGYLSMILIMTFVMAYSLGFGPVPWVIMGEIFSIKVKPYGISLSAAMNWLMVLAGVFCPYEISKFFDTEYVFLVHFVLCLIAVLFAWKIVPETKQFSLSHVKWQINGGVEVAYYMPYWHSDSILL